MPSCACSTSSRTCPTDARGPVKDRLLELFGLIGDADPRVLAARRSLASLLF